ncbi:MarR family transcriptional regulator [Sphingomonas soli]|uniref:MarR family transcriptional regulator n=1 Tax=Sphingomonas soli TaxID=266127 RepID=UPI000A757C25|nr:MarR family transcriptional regulator [Sphingomonas soli]
MAERLRALADACDPRLVPARPDEGASCASIDAPDAVPIAGSDIARRVRIYLAARRRRDALLGSGWFADPAWDLLLDLLASHHERRRVSVSSACIAAAVPATTALRWISILVKAGAIRRIEDPADRRRVYVELAPELAAKLDSWVALSLSPMNP